MLDLETVYKEAAADEAARLRIGADNVTERLAELNLAGLRAVAAAAFDQGEANVYIGYYDQFDTGSRMTRAANPYT